MDFSLRATAEIEAAPSTVFDTITDIDGLPSWNREIPRVIERLSALEPGEQWVVEIRAMGTHWNSRSTVIEADRDRGRFAYRSQSDDGNPSFAQWLWVLTPTDTGTHVEVSVDVRPKTFLRRAFASRMRPPGLRKAMPRSLEALTAHLTTSATSTTTKEQS